MLLFTLHEATEGETARQIERALNYSDGKPKISTSAKTTIDLAKNTEKLKLQIANGVFVNADVRLKSDFEQRYEKYFSTRPAKIDFADGEKSARTINGFVEKNTGGKIDKLFEPGKFSSL